MRPVALHFETILRHQAGQEVRAIGQVLNDFFQFAEIPDYTWCLADSRNIGEFNLSTRGQVGL